MQATTPLVLTLTPAMTARADIASRIGQSPFSADRDAALAGIRTVPYTLKKGETVAQAHGLTVPQLKKLNGLRTFARGFDHLHIAILLDINSQFFLIKRLVIQKTSFFIRRKNDISVRSEQKVKEG